MKNCVWLKPDMVAQIEFTEWTPDGHLRHSKFVALQWVGCYKNHLGYFLDACLSDQRI